MKGWVDAIGSYRGTGQKEPASYRVRYQDERGLVDSGISKACRCPESTALCFAANFASTEQAAKAGPSVTELYDPAGLAM